MFARVLGVTLTQVLRSVGLVLLPTSFVSLLAWATAGSASGNTGDPLRAALWIWLGAHQIPFNLVLPPADVAGYLSYLPLGGLIFPVIAIRTGLARAINRLDGDTSLIPLARILFAFFYTALGTLFALFSTTASVKPNWYVAPIFLFAITLMCVATVGRRLVFGAAIHYGTRIIALLLGIASLAFGISIFNNLSMVQNLNLVLEPGIIGGLLLLLLNILYLPNAIIAALGYFSGTGFAVGAGSLVAPWSFHVNSIPAFPLLGALPKGVFHWTLFGIAVVVLCGALLVSWTVALNIRVLVQSIVVSILLTAVLAYVGSGALITDAMSAMGVSPWKFTLSISGELILGAMLALYIPRIGRR